MLEELHVRDLALIEEAWLEFGPGLTVLTGETGAGKTVLVGALKLLVGERGDASLVRSGSPEALVEGRYFTADEEEHTARRRIAADGRSRCYLDGEMASVGALADALGPLVDLHGQHDHQALLRTGTHASLLDRYARLQDLGASYREAFRDRAVASARLGQLSDALRDREQRLDHLRFVVAEIDAIAPLAGEDRGIEAQLPLMRHGEQLTEASSGAFRSLAGDEGANDAVAEAAVALARVSGLDPALDAIAQEVADLDARFADVSSRLRDYGEGVDYDPQALNEAEARLSALATLKKKYGPALEDVLEAREQAFLSSQQLESGEAAIAEAEAALSTADSGLREAADRLRGARDAAAGAFESKLAETTRDLAMSTARFEVRRTPLDEALWTLDGPERIEFLYAPASGEEARPLSRVASGGEISRVMLALKSTLGEADSVPVLVFDEIDAGIGGATAICVGRRLRELAAGRQVIVITHLAQVAAFADAHLVVEKSEAEGRAHTSVRSASGPERVAEVARMLSGSVSDTSLAHARELIDSVPQGV
jgi:DNA repair protein RecN (Recombination protein N)